MKPAYLLLLLAAAIPNAAASSVWLSVNGMDPDRYTAIDVSVLNPGATSYLTMSGAWAGGILVQIGTVDGTGQVVYGPAQDFFCVDLFHDIYVGQQYLETVNAPDAAANQDRAAWLYDHVLPNFSADPVVSRLEGAALQLAIWDIVHDSGDGFSSGVVQAAPTTDANVIAYAQQYLDLSVGQSAQDVAVFTAVDPNTGLPFQTLMGGQLSTYVPEPATLGIMGGALGAIVLLRRKRQFLAK